MAINTNFLQLPEFDGKHSYFWSIKMKTLLMGKGLLEIVEDGHVEPEDWSFLEREERGFKKEEQHLNGLALLDIRKCIKKNVFPLLVGCRTG